MEVWFVCDVETARLSAVPEELPPTAASKEIDSTSPTLKAIRRWRVPSEMTTVNLPPPKLTIFPLITLPSLSLIVSAKTTKESDNDKIKAKLRRKKSDLKNILPPQTFDIGFDLQSRRQTGQM
jgi:hypothetical protein